MTGAPADSRALRQAARSALARGDLARAQDSCLRLLAADRGDA